MSKQQNNFRQEWWDLIMERFDNIDKKQDMLAADIISIKEKMKWVFGFAAAFSIFFGVAWQIVKDKVGKWL